MSQRIREIQARPVDVRASYCTQTKDWKYFKIDPFINFEDLLQRCIHHLQLDRSITDEYSLKWMDDEGDPCTINSDNELAEAIRLFILSQERDIQLYVFPGTPTPGDWCAGESTKFYERTGARRWKKLTRIMGHAFTPKRFSFKVQCPICHDLIWGIGRQGYKCINCKLLVHKRCCRYINKPCSPQETGNFILPPPPVVKDDKLTPTPQGEPLIGLTDFDMMSVIGRGSYAKVLLVRYKKTKKLYAMKVIKKSMINDEDDIEWVQTEKNVFERASNHPFLVGLHSCFQTSSRIVFVIEFVNGGDMMFHMQKSHKLEEDHARFYAAEIACALNFLHVHMIIYRDLKLDNVLIDCEGHIKLTDYGMCKECTPDVQSTSTFCGTPNYIAPEVLKNEEYSYGVDWWALGVLMYEMLLGRSPFNVNTEEYETPEEAENLLFQYILNKAIRIPRWLSIKAGTVLRALLKRDPEERLACNPETGWQSLKSHPFFSDLDWDLLENRQIRPPFIPKLTSESDLTNFDNVFTDEEVQLTPEDPTELVAIDQTEFEGFEYINPLLLNKEDAV
eukprot:sb/3463527/